MASQMAGEMDTGNRPEPPRVIRMHPNDNVAIVVNDLGLPAGIQLPSGPRPRERVPQAHKVALVDIAEGAPVRRYDVVIGYADEEVDATAADARTAELLEVARREPLLRIRQVIYSTKGAVIMYVLGLYRSDRHNLVIRRFR